jgi:hypothetical protein
MKIRPVRPELFHAGRHDDANSRFSAFCEHAPKTVLTERTENQLTRKKPIFRSICYLKLTGHPQTVTEPAQEETRTVH